MVALAPTFTVATAKAPLPFVPGIFIMPSMLVVAAKTTMSGTEVFEAEKSKVLSPGIIEAGLLFVQSKSNCTSVGGMGALGVSAKTYVWAAPAAICTGVFGKPTARLVAGSVV